MTMCALVPLSATADPGGVATPSDTPMGEGLGLQQDPHPQTDVSCPVGETLFGIDVSKWQGQIDWAAAKNDGVMYAIIRASHGVNTIDEWFDYNWEQTHAHSIPVGVYQYFEPAQDPIAQADLMLAMMGDLQPGDLPPVIDVESSTNSVPAQTAAAVRDWIDHVEEATGVAPIIYTGRYFWQDHVQSDEFVGYPLWIAHYTTGCPNIPAPWPTWAFHQYSSSGSVAGIAGNVDMNLFNGSLEDLMAMTVQDLQPPVGGFDAPACDAVRGFAIDPASDGAPVDVLVSFDGVADDPNALVLTASATLPHATGCDESSCDHGFEVAVPWSRMDGEAHEVHVKLAAGDGLVVAPTAIECVADLQGARLRPIDDAALAAWGFVAATDVLALAEGTTPEPEDESFPGAPLLVVGESVPGTWWIDAGYRRSVDAEAAAAWDLDLSSAMSWPDQSVTDVPEGDPIPSARRAITVGGSTYVVDGAVPDAGGDDAGEGGTGEGDADSAGDGAGGTGNTTQDGTEGGTDDPGADAGEGGGCGCTTDPGHGNKQAPGALLWLVGLGLCAWRRRGDAPRRRLVPWA